MFNIAIKDCEIFDNAYNSFQDLCTQKLKLNLLYLHLEEKNTTKYAEITGEELSLLDEINSFINQYTDEIKFFFDDVSFK